MVPPVGQENEVLYFLHANPNNCAYVIPVLIIGLHPTNERRCFKVTPSLIGWAQTRISLVMLQLKLVLSTTNVTVAATNTDKCY